ncbi:unnamed protein product [Eruca vesicaria subsp. sativa]|uniref:Uncharacterized protein n=1 Tax=Eruca vesicaria subsp. sativa TaxID=29727 RepID=A0ABC8KI51_ERUVS|nr:unnamed protein product [Eruca vesicaria subsp. sativa]
MNRHHRRRRKLWVVSGNVDHEKVNSILLLLSWVFPLENTSVAVINIVILHEFALCPRSLCMSRVDHMCSDDSFTQTLVSYFCRRYSCNNPCVNESDHKEEAEAKETVTRRHSYNNSLPLTPPVTSEIKFEESDYEEETEPEQGPLQSRASSHPPN